MPLPARSRRTAPALVAMAVACGTGTGPANGREPVGVVIVAGNAQIRFPETSLVNDFTVGLVDATGTAAPVAGVPVTWTVRLGGGQLQNASATTDVIGAARARLRLGATTGPQEVDVQVGPFDPVTFTARAVAPGPIVFVSNRRGFAETGVFRSVVGDLHVMNEDGSDVVNLFDRNRQIDLTHDPAWEPDGSHLLYSRSFDPPAGGVPGIQRLGIRLITADGVEDRRVPFSGFPVETIDLVEPTWSPDGRNIVARLEVDGRLYTMNDNGANFRSLSDQLDVNARSPAWSPSGEEIAFVCERADRSDLCVIGADGSNLRQLTDDESVEGEPAWSPDGEWLLYSRDSLDADQSGIWLINRVGEDAREVLAGAATSPAWSPDGDRFVVSMTVAGQRDIYIADLAGGDPVNLTDGSFVDRYPHWRW